MIGGKDGERMVSWVWKMDFNQTQFKWTRMNNINNQRFRHECAIIKVRKSIGKIFDFGVWIQNVYDKVQIFWEGNKKLEDGFKFFGLLAIFELDYIGKYDVFGTYWNFPS